MNGARVFQGYGRLSPSLDVCCLDYPVKLGREKVSESCQESKMRKRNLVDPHHISSVLILIAYFLFSPTTSLLHRNQAESNGPWE